MRLKLLIIAMLFSTGQLFSQVSTNTLNGKVVGADKKEISYFNVELLIDSLTVLQGSFIDGKFTLNLPAPKEYKLKISSFGYEERIIDIPYRRVATDTLTCYLEEKNHVLDGVTVTAVKPKLSVKNNNYVLSVDNTYLANEASINAVITKLPFVLLDSNHKVSMSGKNNVVVYINNRKVVYTQELESISPVNIKDIQLVSNPGPQYDANADAVILIRTRKEKQEGTAFSLKTTGTAAKVFSYDVNPNFNFNYKSINFYLDYIFSDNGSKSRENTLTNNLSNGNKNNIYNREHYKSNDQTYTIGIDYQINKKNRFAFQLLGWNNCAKPDVDIDNFYAKGTEESAVETHKKNKSDENHYDFSLNYESNISDAHQLSLSVNYTLHNTDTRENLAEHHLQDISKHVYDFDSKNKVFDYQFNYKWLIENIDLTLNTGANISYISNKSNSVFVEDGDNLNNRFTYKYDFKELIPGFFINAEKKFNKINTYAGLRIESTTFKGNHENMQVIDTTYVNLFPSLGLNWNINKSNKINLNYTKKISRPSFGNLSPSIRYDNVFFYRQGNPNLLPTITDDISLSYAIKSMRLNIGYRHKKDATIYTYYQDDDDEDITVVKLDNHKSMNFVYVNAFYLLQLKRFTSSTSFTFTKPYAKVVRRNQILQLDRPAYYFKTSNDFALFKNISLYVDFIYNDLGETLLERKKQMYNLSVGMTSNCLNKKLIVNIAINDILNTYKFEDYRSYGVYDVVHEYLPDNTYFQINARYNFSIGKQKKFKVQNNNASTLKRL